MPASKFRGLVSAMYPSSDEERLCICIVITTTQLLPRLLMLQMNQERHGSFKLSVYDIILYHRNFLLRRLLPSKKYRCRNFITFVTFKGIDFKGLVSLSFVWCRPGRRYLLMVIRCILSSKLLCIFLGYNYNSGRQLTLRVLNHTGIYSPLFVSTSNLQQRPEG